jgi:hypothetical protein
LTCRRAVAEDSCVVGITAWLCDLLAVIPGEILNDAQLHTDRG